MKPMGSDKGKISNLNKMTPYFATKRKLREQILSGQFGQGGRFTPELDICRQFNVSRTTVRRAISDIVDEGLLVRYQGRGTFVRYQRSEAQKHLLAILHFQYSRASGAYDLFIRGALHKAADLGFELMVSQSNNHSLAITEQVLRLNELRTAGTIIMPFQTGETEGGIQDRVIHMMRGAEQKIVLADTYDPQSEFPTISSDNRAAVFELTSHLIRMGYRRIAFLTSMRIETVIEREEGFRQAMKEHGLPVPPHYFLETVGTDASRQGYQEVNVLRALREPPEAIVCLHDLIAINVLNACEQIGWRVPEDVAVVGFDGLPKGADTRPPLTTMHQPLYEMGEQAVGLLIDQIEGRAIADPHPRLPCALMVRASCGSSLRTPRSKTAGASKR